MAARKTAASPAMERIREIAYQLWLDAGQPHGQDTVHWLEAEAVATSELAPTPAKKKAPTRKKAA